MKHTILLLIVLAFFANISAQTFNEYYVPEEVPFSTIDGVDIEYVNDSVYVLHQKQYAANASSCISTFNNSGVLGRTKCFPEEESMHYFLSDNSLDISADHSRFVFPRIEGQEEPWGEIFGTGISEVLVLNDALEILSTTVVEELDYGVQIDMTKFTSDEGIIGVGRRYSSSLSVNGEIFLIKFDTEGNEEWRSYLSLSDSTRETGLAIEESNNGEFIVIGTSLELGLSSFNYIGVLARFSAEGEILNYEVLTSDEVELSNFNFALLSNEDALVINSYYIEGEGNYQQLRRYDSDFNLIWNHSYSPFENSSFHLFEIKENQDGSLIGCGGSGSNQVQFGGFDFGCIVKFDEDGVLLWANRYQQETNLDLFKGFFKDIIECSPSGYAVTGERSEVELWESTNYGVWVLKVDEYGCLIEECEDIVHIESAEIEKEQLGFSFWPNPSNQLVTVDISQAIQSEAKNDSYVSLQSMDGKLVMSEMVKVDSQLELDVSTLSEGMYVLSLSSSGKLIQAEKLIVGC